VLFLGPMQIILKTLDADGQAKLTPVKTLSSATLSDLWYDVRVTVGIETQGKSFFFKSVELKNNLTLTEQGVADLDIIELVNDTPSTTEKSSTPAAASKPVELQPPSSPVSQAASTPQSRQRLVDVLADAAALTPQSPRRFVDATADATVSTPQSPRMLVDVLADADASTPQSPRRLVDVMADATASTPQSPRRLVDVLADAAASTPQSPRRLVDVLADAAASTPQSPRRLVDVLAEAAFCCLLFFLLF
jgi:hypothetical protein